MDKEKWKAILWKLLFPHKLLIFLLVNVSAILLIYAFVAPGCPPVVAYASYGISAYALTVVCARMPGIIKKIRKGLYRNRYTNKVLTEQELRIRMSLYGGLIINICFAVFKVVMGVLYQSAWLFAMAGYNTILSIMRFVLVYRDQIDLREESEESRRFRGLHSYRICGWLMLLLNIAISVIVVMVVFENQTIHYPGFMIYAIAAYTFYCMTMGIIHMVKYWNRQNPVFSAVKRLAMAKALVSIFTLQVALITQFGETEGMNDQLANGATGAVVCVVITVMAILMLVDVKKDYRTITKENGAQERAECEECYGK